MSGLSGDSLPPPFTREAEGFIGYLSRERNRSIHTVRAYRGDLAEFASFAAERGIADLTEVDLSCLRAWLGSLDQHGLSRATIARRAATVRNFLAWATREGYLQDNPALRLKAPRRQNGLPDVLSESQLQPLLASTLEAALEGDPAALRSRAVLELLYGSGIRVGELVGLDIDDLDHDRRTVRVLGKGNKERTVPYGVPAAHALNDWLTRGRRLWIGPDNRSVPRTKGALPRPASGPVHRGKIARVGRWHRRQRPARSAAYGRYPSARRRRGFTSSAGTSRAPKPGNHSVVYPCLSRPASPKLRAGSPSGMTAGNFSHGALWILRR